MRDFTTTILFILVLMLVLPLSVFGQQQQRLGGQQNGQPEDSQEQICLAPVDKVVDLGYCAGLSVAYLEAIGDADGLTRLDEQNILTHAQNTHEACYRTDYTSAFSLGAVAFERMMDFPTPDRLNIRLHQCRTLIEHYRQSSPIDGDTRDANNGLVVDNQTATSNQ